MSPNVLGRFAEHSAIAELEEQYLRRVTAAVVARFRRGQQLDAISPTLDIELAAPYLVGGLRRTIAVLLRRVPRPTIDEATDQIWHLIATTLELGTRGRAARQGRPG